MPIDYKRLRNVKPSELENALLRDGFIKARQKGSHAHFKDPKGRRVTVSMHHEKPIPQKTLQIIIEQQAGWTLADLERLKLL
jgi:predicted RNA binding protein YcfA (HicA-like mRNA interferase family)